MSIFETTFNETNSFLLEGSIVDRLKREASEHFDSDLKHATLASSDEGRDALRSVYCDYLNIAKNYELPFLLSTPTWRIDKSVQEKSKIDSNAAINDTLQFFNDLLVEYRALKLNVFLAGRIGPKNDCYKAELAPNEEEAYSFHMFQLEQLLNGGVDYLDATTLPSVAEALGMAKAMSSLKVPYILSFVIRSDAKVLDGTLLSDAIKQIDQSTKVAPISYFINCVHPKTARKAFLTLQNESPEALERIGGFLGNTSLRDPLEYVNIEGLETCEADDYAIMTVGLGKDFDVKALGGCCGTFTEHIEALAKQLKC